MQAKHWRLTSETFDSTDSYVEIRCAGIQVDLWADGDFSSTIVDESEDVLKAEEFRELACIHHALANGGEVCFATGLTNVNFTK